MISQMNYFHHAPLGFQKESIINVPVPGDSVSQVRMENVRNDLLQQPGVSAASFSTFSPLDNDIWANYFSFDHNPVKQIF